jgi:DNA-binding transcriptional MocR family regulator
MTKNLWSQIKLIKSSSKNPQQPIYLQLIKQIDHLITTGQLAVGTSMPTTRELSQKLKLNRNTIVKVYSELQLKGLIESHVGRGTIVASKNTVSPHFDKSVPWAQLLSDASLRLPTRSFPKSSNEDIWLARMQPSAELLPIAEFGSCVEKFFNQDLNSHGNQNNAASLLYAPTSGVVKLRELVVKELAGMGVACDLDEVIITNGSTQGLDLAIRALVNPGDRVLIEDPSYHGGIQLFKLAGANLLPMPTDDQGPDLSRLPSGSMQGIKTCYLIPNFRNPTATTISLKRRQQIADWANQHGILLIEDDYGHELSFDAPVPPPSPFDRMQYLRS